MNQSAVIIIQKAIMKRLTAAASVSAFHICSMITRKDGIKILMTEETLGIEDFNKIYFKEETPYQPRQDRVLTGMASLQKHILAKLLTTNNAALYNSYNFID